MNPDIINFKNFGNSFLMMFRMSTGEDWEYIMYDVMVHSTLYAFIFIIYVVVIQYIMINLFVLVILREFDRFFYQTDNPINQFLEDLKNFKENWNAIAGFHQGKKVNNKRILEFFIMLPMPIGLGIYYS